MTGVVSNSNAVIVGSSNISSLSERHIKAAKIREQMTIKIKIDFDVPKLLRLARRSMTLVRRRYEEMRFAVPGCTIVSIRRIVHNSYVFASGRVSATPMQYSFVPLSRT